MTTDEPIPAAAMSSGGIVPMVMPPKLPWYRRINHRIVPVVSAGIIALMLGLGVGAIQSNDLSNQNRALHSQVVNEAHELASIKHSQAITQGNLTDSRSAVADEKSATSRTHKVAVTMEQAEQDFLNNGGQDYTTLIAKFNKASADLKTIQSH